MRRFVYSSNPEPELHAGDEAGGRGVEAAVRAAALPGGGGRGGGGAQPHQHRPRLQLPPVLATPAAPVGTCHHKDASYSLIGGSQTQIVIITHKLFIHVGCSFLTLLLVSFKVLVCRCWYVMYQKIMLTLTGNVISYPAVLCVAVWPSHQSWMIFWLNNTCYLTSPDTTSLIVDQNE